METAGRTIGDDLRLNIALVKDLLIRFVRDQIRNVGFERAIIGLSGGVDSAVSTSLALQALGQDNTLAVILPHRDSSRESVEDAELVARELGVHAETIDISGMVDSYAQAQNVTDKVRRGNLMARARMIVLYDLSLREKALVIGTSNKTELLLGYGTIHGDLACAINPIGDLYKTQVWQLADALGIPKKVIEKKPTADLWPDQTDEGELGFTYASVDRLLHKMVDERRRDDELAAAGFEPEFISRVREMIRKNQFKRRPPIIAKVSHRTVNVDFRYSRDWGA
ncbi:MAG: NAD+ synthase [Ignavibacteria bacterium]|nr:NAD+ synthase [Ignavibacteria bacterium]